MNGATAGRRVLTLLIGAAVLLVAGPAVAPAWAHSRLLRTAPADGTTVTSPVGEVRLTFNEMVRGAFTTVVVSGPGGVPFGDGPVSVIDSVVHQKTYPLRSGDYRVAWRALSADGHPVEGEFRFTVALPPGQEPTAGPPSVRPVAAASERTGSGAGRWWAGAAAAAALLAGSALVLVRRRRAARQS